MREKLRPMLATQGEPFDSPEHLFEVKWNGVRALAAHEKGRCSIWGRDMADYSDRYPELEVVGRLPLNTVVDGELVLLENGVPDFGAMLARHQLTTPFKVKCASQQKPVTYVLFDLLYLEERSLLGESFRTRRVLLEGLLNGLRQPRLLLSEGVLGTGRAFFERVVREGHEGMMAKHLAGRYTPGRRSPAWRKIKPARDLLAVIIGFVSGPQGFRSLLVAAPREGQLRYVAHVRCGFSGPVRDRLQSLLIERVRREPVVSCPGRAVWVKPDLYCQVRYQEWTARGYLRHARFQRLIP